MSRVVDIAEAKAQLSRLVEDARAGHRVIISKAGKPLVILQPYDSDPEPRSLGGWRGRVWMADDFDAPLPDEAQRAFDGHDA